MILLDTDICVEILRGNDQVRRRREETPEAVCTSFMTAAELYYGARKSTKPERNKDVVEVFLASLRVIQSDDQIVQKFGEIKGDLANEGELVPDADLFVAAASLCYCTKLVTGNTRHFDRIPDLELENWLE